MYLTFLPIARHGKVAMVDGAINCWYCFAVWCLLRGRKDRRWLLGTGLGIGLICLTKGIMMGILLGGILIIFLLWDSPKLLLSPYLVVSLVLGMIPAIAWYMLQYLYYGAEFLGSSLGEQTFNRKWQPVSNVSSPPWYYLLEIAKYGLPWLIFLPKGIELAIKNLHLSWAKLALVWCGVYLLTTSLMVTKLPWYIMPIYPGLSLLIGARLATAWERAIYPRSWKISLTVVTFICWAGSIYLGLSKQIETDIVPIVALVAIAFTIALMLLWSSSGYFILVTIVGFYLGLLLLFNSDYWLWELNEAFPVRPIAATIRQSTPLGQNIYTAYPYRRPSLEFYSERLIVPVEYSELKRLWSQSEPVFLLVNRKAVEELDFKDRIQLGINQSNEEQWLLITQSDR
ncbi:MAG: ArnT family glycosyltransferase [Pleurocapsa sp.]